MEQPMSRSFPGVRWGASYEETMNSDSLLAFAAAVFGGVMALAALFRKRYSLAGWCFFAGMATLAADSVLNGLTFEAHSSERIVYWQTWALVAKSFLPGFWLCFSLTYSRGNAREFLSKWRFILAAAF